MGVSEQIVIREKLIHEIESDLVGPRKGNTEQEKQNEIIRFNPKNEYISGVFYPNDWEIDEEDKVEELTSTSDKEDGDISYIASDKLFKPSSFGLTCRISLDTEKINAKISYGRYSSHKDSDKRIYYSRTPLHEKFSINVKPTDDYMDMQFKNNPDFKISYRLVKQDSDFVLDFYVINDCKRKAINNFRDFLFQPKITLESINQQFCFIDDTHDFIQNIDSIEDSHMQLLFNKKISFGKGHLCSVNWDEKNIKNRRVDKLETSFVPKQTIDWIKPAEPDSDELNLLVDMVKLATCDRTQLSRILSPLVSRYSAWIGSVKSKSNEVVSTNKDDSEIAAFALKNCDIAAKRIEAGISLLVNDKNAFDAFQFANSAIAWQQTMGKWAKENAEIGEVVGTDPLSPSDPRWPSPKWRLFQIAFILMNLESLVNPKSNDRELVDLLWFPTGGGKTEAYLGLVAFTISYRRLRGNLDWNSIGTSVLMRYTLRLLTVQQFQRSATLMCACEKIRLSNTDKWGTIPFQVGLWVGSSVTPNVRGDRKKSKHSALTAKRQAKGSLADIKSHNPYILINCPWCGKKLTVSNGDVCGIPKQWRLFCGRNKCLFSKHLDADPDLSLPVVLVDEDIYYRCPSLIIATVDKFAQIALEPNCKSIFGKPESFCVYCGFFNNLESNTIQHTHPEEKNKHRNYLQKNSVTLPPPELIIQDELHLISGPLGSMAGLYETAIEYLCTNNGVKPKIIASTATTRAASDHISKLFNREKLAIFPPQAIEFGDTFFSQIEDSSKELGKIYLGVMATGKSGLTVLARISAVILRRIRQFAVSKEFSEDDLDPYFTLVSYFNSQRELGGASMNYKDSVPNFISRIKNSIDSKIETSLVSGKQELTVESAEKEDSFISKSDLINLSSETPTSNPEKPKTQTKTELIQDEKRDVPRKYRRHFFELETDELTSRKSSGEIPDTLRRLENKMKSDNPVDLLLATNMLSVGVDIPRLGTMIVNGQPKNHSEYIQATGRIGRANPGLIITTYAYTKPRDLSHYENFKIYHSTYYKNVETVGLTPFTIRTRQIGLFGIIVGMIRMKLKQLSENNDAHRFDPKNLQQKQTIDELLSIIENRVKLVDKSEQNNTMRNTLSLLSKWEKYKKEYNDILKYKDVYFEKYSKKRKSLYYYLLKTDPTSKNQLIPTPTSLRTTEQELRLFYLRNDVIDESDNELESEENK